MAKRKFCAECGTNLVEAKGNPDCHACAPKEAVKAFGVRTHTVYGRRKYVQPSLMPVSNWTAHEITRETATLVELKPALPYDRTFDKRSIGIRFSTLDEARAFVEAAKVHAAEAEAEHKAAKDAESAAREAVRKALDAVQQAAHSFLAARTNG